MIDFALDEIEEMLLDTCRMLASERLRPAYRVAEEAREVPAELAAAVVELGLSTVTVPESAGGAGLDLVARCLVEEELACGDVGIACAVPGPGAAGMALLELGNEAQIEEHLAPFCGPEGSQRFGALAWAESALPGDGRVFATRAERTAAGWTITGEKAYVVNAGHADLFVVAAATGDGGWDDVALFVVPRDTPGLSLGERLDTVGLRAVDVRHLTLDACEVGETARLAGDLPATEGLLRLFARLSLVNAARTLGCSRAAFEYALQYGQERTAFGKPIAHFQGIAFMLADMATELDAGRWLLWRAARSFEGRDVCWRQHVAMAVVHVHETAYRCVDDALQLLGGHGFIQDHPPEKWMRDARTLALIGSPTEVQREHLSNDLFGLSASPGDLLPGSDAPLTLT